MKSVVATAALIASLSVASASAETRSEVRAVYQKFAEAQNARDLARVRSVFLDSSKFLWVSDGMSVWGPDAVLERMSLFQQAEVWRVEPALERSEVVEVAEKSAFLHLPLALVIGTAAAPETIRFLVSVLCVETAQGWRIAALFTTGEKSP